MKLKQSFFILLFALAAIAGAFSVYSRQGSYRESLIFPKGSTYDKEWRKVDSLANKGLTKSALEVVMGIYAKAKAENNAPQFVKAILNRMRFDNMIEENATQRNIEKLEAEIKEARFPVKPVLQSILAQTYWKYYQQNRWTFYNRTAVSGDYKEDDISTWDLRAIFGHTVKNYQASLENTDSLQRTPLGLYDEILVITQPDSRKYRPNLYDFLAQRAADFYITGDNGLTQPADHFELNSESYYWNYTEFAKLNIDAKDTTSANFLTINLLQQLTRFHEHDADPVALIDVDLKRLNYVHNNSTLQNNDTLYLAALQDLEKRFSGNPASAEISYTIAGLYRAAGNSYDPKKSEDHKWDLKKAIEICDATIKKFPGSYGAKNCDALRSAILEHAISMNTEMAVAQQEASRALLTYKNLNKVYVRIVKLPVDRDDHMNDYYYDDDQLRRCIKLPVEKEYTLNLPDDGDYQSHSAEISIPALPLGHYLVLIGSDANFSLDKNSVSYAGIWSSNISYIKRRQLNGSYDLYTRDRTTGAVLANVSLQLYSQKYNSLTRKYDYVTNERYTSDANGYIRIPATSQYRNCYMEFTYTASAESAKGKGETDRLQGNEMLYMYKENEGTKIKEPHTFFFTDRAIYRPGQTVYFKGIMLRSDGESNELMPNSPATVTFYDANEQEIASLNLKTNEYGSFNGTFTAPSGALNGEMYIRNASGAISIAVEEYKRPKFEVSFKPVEGNYRLGEKIKVTGIAKAYSGANIDGAKVSYRVVRNGNFPYWVYYWKGYYPQSPQLEVTSGTTVSNDTGAFFVDFTAIPDASVDKSLQPTYTYTVYADVTDLNGETHSDETAIEAAYTAMNLSVRIPEKLDKQSKEAIAISTTNMSGAFQPAQGTLEIYRLQSPEKTFRNRWWDKPDKHVIAKEEFERTFPKDEYDDENNMYKWPRAEKVWTQKFNNHISVVATDNGKKFTDSLRISNLQSWKPGIYVMEAHSTDHYGNDVKDLKYFTVYSAASTEVPGNQINWFNMITDKTVEPGEKVKFLIGSREADVHVLLEVESKNAIVKTQNITLNNEQKLIELPVEESYRGNFSIHYIFIKNNRQYNGSATVQVPYSNKELDLSFESFRDKLLPGQQEQWKIKIKDKAGDKIAAEMMATMYDASLDEFRPNSWDFNIYNYYYSRLEWEPGRSFGKTEARDAGKDWNIYKEMAVRSYDRLNWFDGNYYSDGLVLRGGRASGALYYNSFESAVPDEAKAEESEKKPAAPMAMQKEAVTGATTISGGLAAGYGDVSGGVVSITRGKGDWMGASNGLDNENKNAGKDLSQVSARSNFAETAFFFPALQTDADGNVIIKFTIPEALTRWKMMGFAHTKDLKYGMIENELVTQKKLMVVPNAPRFFREGDRMEFTSKISNLSDENLSGNAQIWFYDATTMKDVTAQILAKGENAKPAFETKKGQSTVVRWNISIPEGFGAISYKVAAASGNYTDGEEMAVPVLTNRMLVTETLPLPMRGSQTKTFRFEKLISQNNNSTTLRNQKLTLEYTSNPAWYAVQALPYMMEYPYECAEQTFSRFYANSIASHIANSSPKIKAVFDAWRMQTPDALLSNLEKNQDLKSLMLQETPWVLDAKDESERKKRVALLFDLNKMSNELSAALQKLEKMQLGNGGFPWFDGMRDDRYITQHIVTGMGHLDHLGVDKIRKDDATWAMTTKAVAYLDDRIREDYNDVLKYDKAHLNDDHLSYEQIQYLYARSYFKDIAISGRDQKAVDYYSAQAKKYWLGKGRYMQGMIALALNRSGDKATAQAIIRSLKENSISSEEMGMYWKENYDGFYWYQAPVESQALLIEAFDEVANDQQSVNDMKIWLLKSKQTQDWKTTKATAEATYALLLRGTDWLTTESSVEISLGDVKVDPKKLPDVKAEAGTGYFKTSWSGAEIRPSMGEIAVAKKDPGVSWGAVYWQYFEQLDKITPSKTPLAMKKQLFIERNSATGPILDPVTGRTALKVGDKIEVRIELRVDRDMEYVQMKDMRASAFEPVNVLSGYKWQDGLGYYESTKDASTNFFFDKLPKGSYVFEYPLTVTHSGDFSNGITSVQCMYAPEFSSNSEGIRVKVSK